MGFLRALGQTAGLGADVVLGDQADKKQKIADALTAYQQQRQSQQDDMAQSLGQSTLAKNAADIANINDEIKVRNAPPPKTAPISLSKGAKLVSPTGDPIADNPDVPAPKALTMHSVMIDGKPAVAFQDEGGNLFDLHHQPITGKVEPYTPPVQDQTAVVTTGAGTASDPSVVNLVNKTTKQITPLGNAKAPSAAGGGGGSVDPAEKAKMHAQAVLADKEMTRIENRVLSGDLNFGVAAGTATSAKQSNNGVVSTLGNLATGALDPDVQGYQSALDALAENLTNLQSKRFTDSQLKIRQNINGMHGADLAKTIELKRQLRRAALDDPTVTAPAAAPSAGRGAGVGGGTPTGAKQTITQAEFNALKAQFPEATLRARYNIGGGLD